MIGKQALSIFIFFTGFYLFMAGGHFYGQDGVTLYYMGKRFITHGRLDIEYTENTPQGRWGKNGKFYSPFGFGQPILAIPFIALGTFISNLYQVKFLSPTTVSFFNSFMGGICITIFFLTCMELYKKTRVSVLMCFLLGITTFFWPYTKFFYTEPLITSCFLVSFFFLLKSKLCPGNRFYPFHAGLAMGWSILSRPATIIVALVMFIYLWLNSRKAEKGIRLNSFPYHPFIFYCLPVLTVIIFYLTLNRLRFGEFLSFGYTYLPGTRLPMGFQTPLFHGLHILIFSPGKSVFVFAPICIIGIIGLYSFCGKYKHETILISLIFISNTVFYAKWIQPEAGYSWGPRFLLPCVPFLLIPMGMIITNWKKSTAYSLVIILGVTGFCIQFAGVTVNFADYIERHRDEYYNFKSKGYDPSFFPIPGHFRDTIKYIIELPLNISHANPLPGNQKKLEIINWAGTLDFWWIHLFLAGISSRVIGVLLMFNLVILLLGVIFLGKITNEDCQEKNTTQH